MFKPFAKSLFVALIAVLPLSQASAGSITSEYTKLDFDKDCKVVEEFEAGAVLHCPAKVGNRAIFLSDGDLREQIMPGYVSHAWLEQYWGSFSEFNKANNVIEWRIKDRMEFATIHRVFIENSTDGAVDPKKRGQVLVITRVGPWEGDGKACILGYVDARANKDANVLARKVADSFSDPYEVNCDTHQPVFHGKRGKYSGTPTVLSQ